jgi:hypothetical protein
MKYKVIELLKQKKVQAALTTLALSLASLISPEVRAAVLQIIEAISG